MPENNSQEIYEKASFIEQIRMDICSLFDEAVEKANNGQIDEAIKVALLASDMAAGLPSSSRSPSLYIYGFLAQLYLDIDDKENAELWCYLARCTLCEYPDDFNEEDRKLIEDLSMQTQEPEVQETNSN